MLPSPAVLQVPQPSNQAPLSPQQPTNLSSVLHAPQGFSHPSPGSNSKNNSYSPHGTHAAQGNFSGNAAYSAVILPSSPTVHSQAPSMHTPPRLPVSTPPGTGSGIAGSPRMHSTTSPNDYANLAYQPSLRRSADELVVRQPSPQFQVQVQQYSQPQQQYTYQQQNQLQQQEQNYQQYQHQQQPQVQQHSQLQPQQQQHHQPQQHQQQYSSQPQQVAYPVQTPFSPQAYTVTNADATPLLDIPVAHFDNHPLVSSAQHYEQLPHQVSPARIASQNDATYMASAGNANTYPNTNTNPMVYSPVTSPRPLHSTNPHVSSASTSTAVVNNYPMHTTTPPGVYERQLASPESDGGNPFELDESYVHNSSFHYNQGYQNNYQPSNATTTVVESGLSALTNAIDSHAQPNRVHFGPPEFHPEEQNTNDYTTNEPDEPLHHHTTHNVDSNRGEVSAEMRTGERFRDLSAEYNDLYNAELYDIIAYSESQLSASQQNMRQRSPQRFYEDSHLAGRQTRSDSAHNSHQPPRYGNNLSNVSYMSESEDSGERNAAPGIPVSATDYINNNVNTNPATTTNTLTTSTNETDVDYPDDFESYSYDDDVSGYLDDAKPSTSSNKGAVEDTLATNDPLHSHTDYEDYGNENEEGSYSNNDHYNNNHEHDSHSDGDAEFDNVFMYDGSSASALAPVEYDPSMHDDYFNGTIGLDELSRLSL